MIGLPTRASKISRSKPGLSQIVHLQTKRPKDYTFGWMAWCGSGPLVQQEVDISSCSWVAENPWQPDGMEMEGVCPMFQGLIIVIQLKMDL